MEAKAFLDVWDFLAGPDGLDDPGASSFEPPEGGYPMAVVLAAQEAHALALEGIAQQEAEDAEAVAAPAKGDKEFDPKAGVEGGDGLLGGDYIKYGEKN